MPASHMNENISKAAATALDAILSSDSATRESLRKHLLANLSTASSRQYSFTVKAVAQIFTLDIITMHDFPTIFAALHYPPEIQAPILEYTLRTVADDSTFRREMIEAGFVNIFKQALSVELQPKEEVQKFLTRSVEAAAIEIGRLGYTPDIIRVSSHRDQLTSVAILLGVASIAVNGTEDDKVRLIHDGFLDELLRLSNRDSLAPGTIKLLQQSIPGLSDAILKDSKVTVFLLSLLWYAKSSLLPRQVFAQTGSVTSMRPLSSWRVRLWIIFSQMETPHLICYGPSCGPPFQRPPKFYASSLLTHFTHDGRMI